MEQPQKRPQELLGLDDDSDNAGSASEEEWEEEKRSQHRTKRRRVVMLNDDDSDNPTDDEEEKETDPRFAGKLQTRAFAKASSAEPEPAEPEEEKQQEKKPTKTKTTNANKLKPLTHTELAASNAATAKTGVIYLSRIPPFMKPQKVRDLLSAFGNIGRVFLAPEDPKSHAKRVKFGGNKKRNFVEGWIEFLDKKDAKLCAETLNTQMVGGKKGSYYYDDVWNMKYLPKFKWHHLQAQIAYENASRQAKMRQEIAHETRINKTYLRNVERAKMVENMQEAKRQKRKAAGEDEDEKPAEVEVRRQFRQHKVKGSAADKKEGKEKSDRVKNLLSSVF